MNTNRFVLSLNMEIQQVQDRIVREFEVLSDWTERYKYIIKHGAKMEELSDEYKTEDNLVRGCQSQVWLTENYKDGKLYFNADSDAAITKGLVSFIVRLYNGNTPSTILKTEPEFISKIGMAQHLSPTRANGLASMVKKMKTLALAYQTKETQNT